jgi:serine/threonine protein kinase
MLQALQYVHGKKILHRDIKAMNVFLDENMDCKLGDFGVSKILDRPLDMTATIIGTPLYMSPELCKNIPYDARSDVWALGCIVYEMCTLLHPFEHVIRDYQKNPLALAQAVTKGAWNRNALVHYSPEMTQIIEQCLAIDPSRRPTVDQLLDSEPLRRQLIRFGLIPNKSPSSSQEGTEVKKHDQQICPPTTQVTPLSSPKVTPPQPIHQLPAHSLQQQQQQHLPIIQPVRITPLPVPQKPNTANAQQVPSYQPYNYNQHMYQPQAPYYINQQPVVQQQQYYQPAPQQQQQQQPFVYQPQVNIPQVQPSQPHRQQKTGVCPFCHGSKIFDSAECGACSGQGYIYCSD